MKEELSFPALLKLYKQNRKFITLFVIIFLVIVLLLSYILPYQFEASASLLPPQKRDAQGGLSSFLQSFSGGGGSIMLGGMGQTNQSQLYSDILKSRAIAVYIDREIGLSKNPLYKMPTNEAMYNFIRDLFDVEIEKSGVVKISCTFPTGWLPSGSQQDSAAQLAAKIANSAAHGLDYVLRNKNISSAKFSKEYIEREIGSYHIKLDSVESALEKFQKANKVLAIDEQTVAIVQQAIDIGAELAKAEIELNLAKHDYNLNSPIVRGMQSNVESLRKQYHKVQSGGLTDTDEFAFPLANTPALAREYASLFRERKILEQVIIYLETQRHQEAIQEQRDIPLIEILDEAVAPETRVSPSRKLMMIFGLVLSLAFSLSYVTIKAVYKGNLEIKKSIEN